jgi:acetyl esterase/lipase
VRILAVRGPGIDERCRTWGAALGVEVDLRQGDPATALASGTEAEAVVIAPGAAAFGDAGLADAVAGAGVPVVAVDPANLRKALDPAASPVGRACARVIYGRGDDTARYAVAHLVHRTTGSWSTSAYGDGPDQVGDLWPRAPGPGPTPTTDPAAATDPAPARAPAPVVVLVHGGFWYHAWERDLMDGLAADLAGRGIAAWNLEYRRVGAGGGWPATGADMAAGLDHLVALAAGHGLDLNRVVMVGHSAGAQLALWAAARPEAAVRPGLIVGLAAICDLARARRRLVGGRSVDCLVGTAPDPKAALRDASPLEHLPLGVAQLLVHAVDDRHVPVDQSRRYVSAAQAAGDAAELLELRTGEHFALIDPTSGAWAEVAARIVERFSRPQ